MRLLPPPIGVPIPDGLPPWIVAFVDQAVRENATLAANGAEQAFAARVALLSQLLTAARAYLEDELNVREAAALLGRHPETIRRAIRSGALPHRRDHPGAHPRIRRADLHQLVGGIASRYDPQADAQDIARRRRPR